MINLFEYRNKAKAEETFDGLEEFLDDIWKNREKSTYFSSDQENFVESQQFLQFLHKTKEIKSNKYAGVIRFEGQVINLLPKIFYDSNRDYHANDIYHMQNHILWWLSYCRKIKFPNYQTSMGNLKSDFFEILIYLFSKYTRQLLSNTIYQQFEEVNKELQFIKGRLNTTAYITENLSTGRWHQLNCTYDAFVVDNKFNRIIKHVTNLLFNATMSSDNKKQLREILFILDEVSDVRVTAEEVASIKFNPMFGEFETVRDYCHLFLSNSISFNFKNELKLFAFLLPMEYVFEDFIFGFIEKEIEEVNAKAQVGSTYLDVAENFALRPDLMLKMSLKTVIADTKYKIVYSDDKDPKKGISQSDLYQMLAYAVRFKIDEIILFYPNTIDNYQEEVSRIKIEDALAENKVIQINSYQLPILNKELFSERFKPDFDLNTMFESTKKELIEKIKKILIPKID